MIFWDANSFLVLFPEHIPLILYTSLIPTHGSLIVRPNILTGPWPMTRARQAKSSIHKLVFWRFGHRPIENEHLKPPKFIMLKNLKPGGWNPVIYHMESYGHNTILFIGTSSINGLSMAKGFLPPPTPQLRSTQPSRWRTSWVLAARTSPSPVESYWCGLQNGLSEDGCPKNGDSNGETYDQPCFFLGTLFPDKPTWSNDHLNLRRPVWFVIPSMDFLKPERSSLSSPSLRLAPLCPQACGGRCHSSFNQLLYQLAKLADLPWHTSIYIRKMIIIWFIW